MSSDVLLVSPLLIGAAVMLLFFYREDNLRKESLPLRVSQNLGDKAPTQDGCLAWFCLMSPPVVIPYPTQLVTNNLLVFEDYPLFPVKFRGRWISPGESVVVEILKDDDGNPLEIRVIQ